MFRALSYRNFRLFFGGQSISLIGTWMQRTAMSWLVYSLTHSTLLLGVIGFADQIPTFFLSPVAGVLIDRWNRHRVLVVTQILGMFQALILAALVLTETVAVWHVLLLALFLGSVNAFDIPTRQAFVVNMVEDREALGNAIALGSTMVHAARMLGPSLAGILIGRYGEGVCFFVNGLSYVPVLVSLALMKLAPPAPNAKEVAVVQGLKEGFRYASGLAPIRSILLFIACLSLLGLPYMVLMPVFATDLLHGGAETLGFLMGSSGLGALFGAFYLASRRSVAGLWRTIPAASAVFGVGLVALSYSRSFWLSVLLMLVAGCAAMLQLASSNTLVQTIVDEDKRGRIMSLFTMAFLGIAPFGSLLEGSLATHLGAPNAVMVNGLCCLLGAGLFARKLPSLRTPLEPLDAAPATTRTDKGLADDNPRSS